MKPAASLEQIPWVISSARVRGHVEELLAECGIAANGPNAWDIQVHDERFFARVLGNGSMGLGESYMDGWWDVRDLVGLLHRLLAGRLDERVKTWRAATAWLTATLVNLQGRSRAFEGGQHPYDLGNDFYEGMLDSRMMYSCAYWDGARTLDDAQEGKLRLTLDKLVLRRGQRLLDVGGGWGGALKFAAERYGITGVGINMAKQQVEYARRSCVGLPLKFRVEDYRDLRERFDHAVSIGMFEHVGVRNYRRYMRVVRYCLRPGGRFLLHCIGTCRLGNHTNPWIHRHIFPNSMFPGRLQINRAADGIFRVLDWQSIGAHYERTLLAWRANFERSWPRLAANFDERFRRMWLYYLGASAAAFRARKLDVWQVLLEPESAD